MGTPVRNVPPDTSGRFPKRRKPRLDPDSGTKVVTTVYLVIRTMRSSDGSIVEQPISAHPTTTDAIAKQQNEESDNTLGDGIKFSVVGFPVTRVVKGLTRASMLVPSPTQVGVPPQPLSIRGTSLSLVNNLEGDEEEEDDGSDET